ncbi:E2 family protein B [Paracoccus solventivorans]|uniref:E2 family protein B n=1 Tax=Paracoccus solventivorans TaxID=53463 RepID=A0A1M7JUR8_9RHOB|nr:ThiF family adenylyltransferase [Paracoccus solventivorans]SHM56802.1 E2 family protein B [Paracoccus solventivorans]
MIWWLEDPARAHAERRGVAELAEQAGWLGNVRWYLTDGAALSVDFDVEHEGEVIPLTMTYSGFHPNAPPTVVPRDGARLSGHQYGDGGSLCLEFRADNWTAEITGAMMVESAYRLLANERGAAPREVPSAHRVSLGQSVRGTSFRFLVTQAANERLRHIEPGRCVEIGLVEKLQMGVVTTTVTEVDGSPWIGAWPAGVPGTSRRCYAVRLPLGVPIPSPTKEGVASLLNHLGLDALRKRVVEPGEDMDFVILTSEEPAHFAVFDGAGDRHFCRSRTLMVQPIEPRVPDSYAALAGKSIGLVGCGSLGSKVAVMLLRAGLRRFTLVDDDILMEANLARNELAAPAVGVHKVDALRARLVEVAGEVEVSTRRVALGGQESAESTESVMSVLQACDVIVDATADPVCFNFCAAVARAGQKPMVWGEVFGGGIGGLVARVRPGHEPEPQAARNQIVGWCNAHGVAAPLASAAAPYAGTAGNEAPLLADDAEVAIVAGHVARLTIDVLVHPDESAFPSPAYAVGLSQSWIFSAPFETWPIELIDAESWKIGRDVASMEQSLELLRELVPNAFDDHDQPTQ